MRSLILALTASATFITIGCERSSAEPSAASDDWRELTDGPRLVMEQFRVAPCASARPADDPDDDTPHDNRAIRVYANAVGSSAIDAGRPLRFESGTVIVKRKFGSADSIFDLLEPNGDLAQATERAMDTPNGVAVMIKREPGYAPGEGDWQYLYFEPGEEAITDPIAARDLPSLTSCATCHNQAARQDYVYVPYLTETAPTR